MKKIISLTMLALIAFSASAFAETFHGTVTIKKHPTTSIAEEKVLKDICTPINIETEEEKKARIKQEKAEKRQKAKTAKQEKTKGEKAKKTAPKPPKQNHSNDDSISGLLGGNILGKIFG